LAEGHHLIKNQAKGGIQRVNDCLLENIRVVSEISCDL